MGLTFFRTNPLPAQRQTRLRTPARPRSPALFLTPASPPSPMTLALQKRNGPLMPLFLQIPGSPSRSQRTPLPGAAADPLKENRLAPNRWWLFGCSVPLTRGAGWGRWRRSRLRAAGYPALSSQLLGLSSLVVAHDIRPEFDHFRADDALCRY